jgi:hypothetical protein
MLNLYLDIDGVILGKNEKGEEALIPNLNELLIYTREHFHCFWLSTHGRHGLVGIMNYLRPYSKNLDPHLASHITALRWNTLKTESIDYENPFIWVDDRPLAYELDFLKKMGCLHNWLHVDTYDDYNSFTVEVLERKHLEILRS